MTHPRLLPAIGDILKSIRRKEGLEKILHLIIEHACHLAKAAHGSFALVDHEAGRLSIATAYGSDWTTKKKLCQLQMGQGLTGKAAATGQPLLCRDTREDPAYFPLFSYVRSELVVPVFVHDRVWGVINIDGAKPGAFDDSTLELLVVFAELASAAITLHLEATDQDRLYRKLVQSEKLASLGETIAGIAHEINNPLTAVLGYATLLEGSPRLDDRDKHATSVIMSESQRAAGLIRSLLEFSRKETGTRERVDARTLVQKAANLRRYQLAQGNIKLQVTRSEDDCTAFVCPQQISQVLHNLITNAEQAIPRSRKDGLIRIVTAGRREGGVIITVSDNGAGIPAAARDRIFDPFFTTKRPGEGTGLGLAICHTIMAAHGGTIALVESSVGGTTFALELPAPAPALLFKPESAPPFAAAGSPALPPLRGRVLVVDDEAHIAEAVTAYLVQQRFDVTPVNGAKAALALLGRAKFDIVVSDMRMPDMDGVEFHETVCRQHPRYKQRFIFVSGYLMHPRVKAFLTSTRLPYLEKPFSFDELDRTITRHLDSLGGIARAG